MLESAYKREQQPQPQPQPLPTKKIKENENEVNENKMETEKQETNGSAFDTTVDHEASDLMKTLDVCLDRHNKNRTKVRFTLYFLSFG